MLPVACHKVVLARENMIKSTKYGSYARGNDLSGSLEGAGGIGGLLARSSAYNFASGNPTTHSYYFADGNGNITYMLDNSQSMVASYRYDPFGNTISKSGTLADDNVYRFSSKEFLINSGLYYFGFRFYDPSLQRWINRDPIQEGGGFNLYSFINNSPPNELDADGLEDAPASPKFPIPAEDRKCCDSQHLDEGERALNRNFNRAVAAAAVQGLAPATASCKMSSGDILYEWLTPTPMCWKCYLEERDAYRNDTADRYLDHQVITCVGYSSNGSTKQIIFDWWGDTQHKRNWSGGPPDPFRHEYPYVPPGPSSGLAENPYYTTCSGDPHLPHTPTCSFPGCGKPKR